MRRMLPVLVFCEFVYVQGSHQVPRAYDVLRIQEEIISTGSSIQVDYFQQFVESCPKLKEQLGINDDTVGSTIDLSSLSIWSRNKSDTWIGNLTAGSILASRSDPEEKLIIFAHGFNDNPSSNNFVTISNVFLQEGIVNTIYALDSQDLITKSYLHASTNVRFVGEALGDVLADLNEAGVPASLIHLIGHSLGAHICGYAGERFHNRTGSKISRISGLDPAGPCFIRVNRGLSPTDAEFVDVIHSDGNVLGTQVSIGHVDFYPNHGIQVQPGCFSPDEACSHERSVAYYSESVVNPAGFLALSCADWDTFVQGQCGITTRYMGYSTSSALENLGRFYLKTGPISPYALGLNSVTV